MMNTATTLLPVGTVLHATYRIDAPLSSGGFGNTYVATNLQFDERVAIKEFFLRPVAMRAAGSTQVTVSTADGAQTFDEQREKFRKEARRLRHLKNEHIVGVYDLFDENGTTYYVMDYIEGESLAAYLKRTGQPLGERRALQLARQVVDALSASHAAGILHLDLKPANIMLGADGAVRLIDFGASKQQRQRGGATTSTAVSYTNGYAPREQMEQNLSKFGAWTDFYALGATLYTLLTNRQPPLPSDIDDDRTADKHQCLPLPATVTAATRRLLLRLMATNRLDRPQTDAEVLALMPAVEPEQPAPQPEVTISAPKRVKPQPSKPQEVDEASYTAYKAAYFGAHLLLLAIVFWAFFYVEDNFIAERVGMMRYEPYYIVPTHWMQLFAIITPIFALVYALPAFKHRKALRSHLGRVGRAFKQDLARAGRWHCFVEGRSELVRYFVGNTIGLMLLSLTFDFM